MGKKPTIGVFSLTACAGCQFNFLFLGKELMQILTNFDVKHFEMVKEFNQKGKFDIAFVEGCVSTPEQAKKLKEVRASTKYLIALGTCATYGGVPSIRNFMDVSEVELDLYPNQFTPKDLKATGINNYVKVDYFLRGCPMIKEELVMLVKHLILGKNLRVRDDPVCIECREKGNICLLQQGKPCMGPITYGGCGAPCPSDGFQCKGCRGPNPDSNLKSEIKLLEKAGFKEKDIKRYFRTFAGTSKIFYEGPE